MGLPGVILMMYVLTSLIGCSVKGSSRGANPNVSNETAGSSHEETTDDEDWLPALDPTNVMGTLSWLISTREELLVGAASNGVQDVTHPVFLVARSETVKALASVKCGLSWGREVGQTSLATCGFKILNDNIVRIQLPATTANRSKSGFGTTYVNLYNSAGQTLTDEKTLQLYFSPTVRGLLPCQASAIISDLNLMLGSPSFASLAASPTTILGDRTPVKINYGLEGKENVIDRYSLRTNYAKIRHKDIDYVLMFKAWPSFTSLHYKTASSPLERCKMGQKRKTTVLGGLSGLAPKTRSLVDRFEVIALSAAGKVVGVDSLGAGTLLMDANEKELNVRLGQGLEKSDALDCIAGQKTSPERAPIACINVLD